ncbi:MAG: transposase [Verrucomicrobia bacterium]|nr:transposase [Verrucomicrobiota bacterium]
MSENADDLAGRPYLWACACEVVDKPWVGGITEAQSFAARDAGLGEAGRVVFITICCQQRGVNQLCRPELAQALIKSVRFRQERGDWYAHLFLLMPDHLHALLSFPPESSMKAVVAKWKEYSRRQLGIVWQRGFFDHRLRKAESLDEKVHYIRMNPVRQGLVARAEEWPWIWEAGQE